MVATITPASARAMKEGSGSANQRQAVATQHTAVRTAKNGFRGPAVSEIAPTAGASTAISSPLMAIALPHNAVPVSTFGAMPCVK